MPIDQMGRTVDNTYDFQPAMQERLEGINAIGESQNQYVAEAAQRRMAQRAQEDQDAMNSARQEGQNSVSGGVSGEGAGDNFDSFKNAIGQQESGGDYGAQNKDSGAMGKYQVMKSNIEGAGGWDKEAIGRDITASQYMASPELQEKIAGFKLKKYYDKYGAAGAAVAWYAGPGSADKFMKTGAASKGSEGNYPTQYKYVQDILNKMGTGVSGSKSGNGAVDFAAKMKGVPYQWGGTSTKGFDCSGLVQAAYKSMGRTMPRTSQEQATMGRATALGNLASGDLVAWGSSPGTAHHIAIYAGNGMVWEAPRAGLAVRLRKISQSEKGIMGISMKR